MKNKQNKIANFLKLGTLLLGFSLFLWNCEKDEVISNEKNKIEKHTPYVIKPISEKELINNPILQDKIELFNNNSNTASKNSTSTKYNFTINKE